MDTCIDSGDAAAVFAGAAAPATEVLARVGFGAAFCGAFAGVPGAAGGTGLAAGLADGDAGAVAFVILNAASGASI